MEQFEEKISYIDLAKLSKDIRIDTENALSEGVAETLQKFLGQRVYWLGDRLVETQILGVPALAIFSSMDLCCGLCEPISRLFVLASLQPEAMVVSGISKKIAYHNYAHYKEDEQNASHTWAEIKVGDTTWALDFTDQLAMPAQKYYEIYRYDVDKLIRKSPIQIAAEGLIDECYVALANRMQYLANKAPRLLQEYDLLFSQPYYSQDISDVKRLMGQMKELLVGSDLAVNYPSLSHLLAVAKSYQPSAKLIENDQPMQKVISCLFGMYTSDKSKAEIKDGNEALANVFEQTNAMADYIANLKQQAALNYGHKQITMADMLESK